MEQEALSPNIPLGEVSLKKKGKFRNKFLKQDFFHSRAQMYRHHVTERNFAEKFIFLLNYSNGYLTSCEKKKNFSPRNLFFCSNARRSKSSRQGATKWPTGPGKGSNPRLLGALINFRF